MRLLRRNTVEFLYYPVINNVGTFTGDMVATGWFKPEYGDPVVYRGTLSTESGFATDTMQGVETPYTHVMLMDNVTADISELGVIQVNGRWYEVKAVRRSRNVLNLALKLSTMAPVEHYGEASE